jgi:hypothetical protein
MGQRGFAEKITHPVDVHHHWPAAVPSAANCNPAFNDDMHPHRRPILAINDLTGLKF